jgi:hypothetical protein
MGWRLGSNQGTSHRQTKANGYYRLHSLASDGDYIARPPPLGSFLFVLLLELLELPLELLLHLPLHLLRLRL